jgi:hypothetical protein
MQPSSYCADQGPLWLFCELGVGVLAVGALLALVSLVWLVEALIWGREQPRSSGADEAQNDDADHE